MFKNRTGQIRSGWMILLAFIVMYMAQGIFMIPGIFLLGSVEADQGGVSIDIDIMAAFEEQPWISLLAQGGGTLGGIVSTLWLWRYFNKKPIKELGFKGPIRDLWFGLVLGAVSIALIFLLLLVTGNVVLTHSLLNPEFTAYTLSYLAMFILVGFFEEMFFRGYVMSTMADRGNKKWFIYVVSALFFSIVHGANPNVSMLGLVNIALVGVLFAYMFDTTKSLWLPIGYHITWNYFQGNVFGFAVSGIAPHSVFSVDITKGNNLLTGGSFGLEGGLLVTILIIASFFITKMYAKRQRQFIISKRN